ncbi:MAG: hypothetical protein PHN89_05460 [Candidatus Pacebacteria bacterium]|nr:hypothetical protein [Candidatus Paceibacterota bacterium]MDD5222457.1 hypothetical protein [bacterium]
MIQIPDKVPDVIKAKLREYRGQRVYILKHGDLDALGYLTDYNERSQSVRMSASKDDPDHNWSMFYAGWIKSIKKTSENAG